MDAERKRHNLLAPETQSGISSQLGLLTMDYCRERNYSPSSFEFFSPTAGYLTRTGFKTTETWISLDGARLDSALEKELIDVLTAAHYLQSQAFGFQFHLAPVRTHLAFLLPKDQLPPGNQISGGDNVILNLPWTDRGNHYHPMKLVLFLSLPNQNQSNASLMAKQKMLGLAIHEMTHSTILAGLIRNNLLGVRGDRCLPNHLHPLLDEGLSVATEGIRLAAMDHLASQIFNEPNVLTCFFQDPDCFPLLCALSYNHHWGATCSRENLYTRGYSSQYSAFLKGIEQETIQLLEPQIVNRLNFRRKARTHPQGRISPAFVDQDEIILGVYPVGAVLCWALAQESLRMDQKPLEWFGALMGKIQQEYSHRQKGAYFDIRNPIQACFPGLDLTELNLKMIRLLKTSTEFAAEISGDPEPKTYLARYLVAHDQYQGLPERSKAMKEVLANDKIILAEEDLSQRSARRLIRKIKDWQRRSKIQEMLKSF